MIVRSLTRREAEYIYERLCEGESMELDRSRIYLQGGLCTVTCTSSSPQRLPDYPLTNNDDTNGIFLLSEHLQVLMSWWWISAHFRQVSLDIRSSIGISV